MNRLNKLQKELILFLVILLWFNVPAQTKTRQIFLSDPSQSLDLIDPVATSDSSTSQSELLGYFPSATAQLVNSFSGFAGVTSSSVFTLPNVEVLSGLNRLMLVGVSAKDGKVTDITYNGVSLNLVGKLDGDTFCTQAPIVLGANSAEIYIYSYLNPPIGTADVVVTLDSDYKKGIVVGASNYSEVNPSNPFGTFASASYNDDEDSPFDLYIPSANGNLVFDISTVRNGTQTMDIGQTELYNINSGSEVNGGSSTEIATSTSTLTTWSSTSCQEVGRAGIAINGGYNTEATFLQSFALCEALTIKSSEPISVSTYLSVDSGVIPTNPSISAELKYGSTNIITLTNPTYNSSTGLITWTGALGSDTTVPLAQSIALTITTTELNVGFYIDFDSETKPSKIEFSTDSSSNALPPSLPSGISGNTNPSNGTSASYSVINVPGLTYNWVLPSGWTQTSGDTTNTITVTVGSQSGNLSVTPNNGSCDGDTQVLSLFTATKQLYLSDPSQALDRIDPVASADTTTTSSPVITVGSSVTVDLIATQDTGIKLKNDDKNYGSCTSITIDRETTDSQRMLVQFDLSSIPAGAVIESAELQLNCTSGADMDVSVFKIGDTDTWDEGTLCGTTGVSNWVQRTSSSNWSALGAIGPNSNSGTPLSTININSTGIQTWPVTCLVEDWVSGVSTNNGMALSVYQASGGMGNRTATYDSRETSTGVAPTLRVTYSTNAVAFKQTPEFCSPFTIIGGTPVVITNYVSVVSGAMPANPDITAILKTSCSNTIITITDPSYDTTTNLITWSGSLVTDNTIPTGEAITLVVISNESGVEFTIDYDSQTKPSKVEFDTSTFINIPSFQVYDAPYPGGSVITSAEAGSLVYLRAEATDPFGSYDITDLETNTFGTQASATLVNTTSCSKIFEQEVFLSTTGSLTFSAEAKEGLENTVTDTETVTLSVISTKIDFDGTDDYVDFGDVHDLTSSYSLEAWVLQEATKPNATVLSKGNNKTGSKNGYQFNIENNFPSLRWFDNTGAEILNLSSPFPITNNKWHQIATTFDGSVAKLYIDGIKVAEESLSASLIDINEKFIIGAKYNSDTPNSPDDYFNGFIDEVRVWNVSLTEIQIREMMNQEIEQNGSVVKGKIIPLDISGSLLWSDLQGYYPFDENIASDKSENNNNGLNKNISTLGEQTTPLPYTTRIDNQEWTTNDTWTNYNVWNSPNSIGVDGITPIDWNIVKLSHNVSSGDKDITVLGLILDTANKELTIAEPTEALDYQNSGQSLRITDYLELDGILDLVGESQLLQDEGSILDADSSGYLEKDQQGTANSFNYNYWSSSVGPIGSTGARGTESTNENFTIYGALLDGSSADDGVYPKAINFQSSYTAADTAVSDPITLSSYWLWKYNGSNNNYYAWQQMDQNTPMLPGEGFTMKGTSGIAPVSNEQNYVFRGKPYNGNFTLPIEAGNDRLIGNPYPSAIDSQKFILDNISTLNGGNNINGNIINGALYFWDHFGEANSHNTSDYIGGYATRNLIAGVPAIANDIRINATGEIGTKIPGQFIPTNQGFFVITTVDAALTGLTTVDGGDIIFKNSHRAFKPESVTSSVFMKNSDLSQIKEKTNKGSNASFNQSADIDEDSRPIIRLKLDSPIGLHRQIVVGIDKNASNSFDIGYDAAIADKNAEDLFWIIENSNFVIQGVNNFNSDQELPLGLTISQSGLVRLSLDALENIDSSIEIYIKDNEKGETYNINENPFEIELEAGEYLKKFSLVFQPRLKTLSEVPLQNGIFIFMNNPSSSLEIKRIVDTEIQSITMYNTLGQFIHSWDTNLTGRNISLPINTMSTGIYLIQLQTKNGVIKKKIIIK
ncbi:MAG: LamG-like jellyroll fold domain-containing protein [Algibacter sp.]|uniref:LamG-like jellyroll fold domain-containing protein n=1 Tax=Algibacter sp. TaxID=1872428 RepID=UPI0032983AE6